MQLARSLGHMRMQPDGDVTSVCDVDTAVNGEDCHTANDTAQVDSVVAGPSKKPLKLSGVQNILSQASFSPLQRFFCTRPFLRMQQDSSALCENLILLASCRCPGCSGVLSQPKSGEMEQQPLNIDKPRNTRESPEYTCICSKISLYWTPSDPAYANFTK